LELVDESCCCAAKSSKARKSLKGSTRGSKGAPTGSAAEPVFPPGSKAGIAVANCAPALDVLRGIAATFYVTAQQVDLLAELFDDAKDKVP
jgi:hypothetical protein